MRQDRIFPDVKLAAVHQQSCYNEMKHEMEAEGQTIDWDVTNKAAALDFITEELLTEWGNRKTLSPRQAQGHIMAEANEIYAEWLIIHYQKTQSLPGVPK